MLTLLLFACSGDALDTGADAAAVAAFGNSRVFTEVATSEDGLEIPRDLEFHPERPGELWTVNRAIDGVVLLTDPGTDAQESQVLVDAFSNHFMEEVSSFSFGAATWDSSTEITFATCQESRNTYDDTQNGNGFMGPALWPSDLDVYAQVNQNLYGMLAGSHLDMLHGSPYCMGIVWESENVYWVFDGKNDHLVRYDFQKDHDTGYDDHSDGIIRRYEDVELTRTEDVPGHMVFDHDTGWIYIADTGAGRVIRVDSASGEVDGLPTTNANEPLAEYSRIGGATVEVLIEGLPSPSGLALRDGILYVADHESGELHAYDTDGNWLYGVETPASGLMGIEIGPEGHIWYVDGFADTVVRLDPEPALGG